MIDRSTTATGRRGRTARAAGGALAALALVLGSGAAASASTHGRHGHGQRGAPSKQALRMALDHLMGHPKFTPPGPALNVKKLPKSTKVVVIDNTPSVGPLQQAAVGAMNAAKAAGLKPKLLNGGANNTAADDISLLEQAVNLHPAVVLQVGILTPLETAGLKYAKAHHVPVIAVSDNEPKHGAPGEGGGPYIAGTSALNYTGLGKVMAEYVGAYGPPNAQIGMITTDDIIASPLIERSFKSELHRVCPHCTVVAQNVDTANWTTEVTSTVTSMLDAHPNMKYLFPIVDGMTPWLVPALKARPKRPEVISVNATPGVAMAAVKSGLYTAEAGTSANMIGWYAFDSALRVLLHKGQQKNPQEPMTLFTTSEMVHKHLKPNSDASLFGSAYKTGFKRLWGVGSASTHGRHGHGQRGAPSKQALRMALDHLMGHPKFTPPGPALNVKKLPKSTKVVVIDNTPSVGPLQQAAVGAMNAAKAAGLKPKLLNGGANNTAADDISLLEQAVNLHPAVVLQVGILTPLETAGLKYAKAHHVPVIAVDDNQPKYGAPGEGSGPYTAGTAQENDTGLGKVMAEYVGAYGPPNAQIGMITTDDIVPSHLIQQGFKSELHRVCPHCTVVAQNVDTANWTTEVTSTVTSMLDAHPNMKYLFPIVDGMTPWLVPALKARPKRPEVISVNATPGVAMAAVKSGLYTAEAGTSANMIGWYAFDSALRVLLHKGQQKNPQEPMTLFTTSEMVHKHLKPNSDASLFGSAYKTGFKRLWGVG